MRRIPASCSILRPRLNRAERRGALIAAVIVGTGAAVYALATSLPLIAGPLVACGLCLVRWITIKLPAHRVPRGVANDNEPFRLSYSGRPVLRPVIVTVAYHAAPHAGDGA